MSSSFERAIDPAAEPVRPPPEDRLAGVYVGAVILSACSILYELLAAQTLTLLAGCTVVWYSLTVGVFLAAMGFGALLSRRVGRESPWLGLYRIEVALTILGGLAVILIHFGHIASVHFEAHDQAGLSRLAFLGTGGAVVAAVGVLTGIELPLLMRIGRDIRDESGVANTILGLDYFGSLIGALAFPILLLPNLDLVSLGFTIALVNLVVATVVLLKRLDDRRWFLARLGGAGLVWVALVIGLSHLGGLQQYFLKKYYYYLDVKEEPGETWANWKHRFAPMPEFPDVERHSSRYQKIDLMRDVAPDYMTYVMQAYSSKYTEEPDYPRNYILFLNGDFQTNTTFDEVYHEWFAHVPVITTGNVPKRVLLLGGGDGLLLKQLLKYDELESVLHIDIDPVLIQLSRTHEILRAANHDSFHDPRVTTKLGDGYQFVRRSKEEFDAIYIDFPTPMDYDLAKLYSREFFHFVRERLTPEGYAVFDAVGTSLVTPPNDDGERWVTKDNDWPIYYHTLRKAGFGTIVPYLSSLESDNPAALALLRNANIRFGPDFEGLLEAAGSEEEKQRLVDEQLSTMLVNHVILLEQGFIFMMRDEREIVPKWRDNHIPLYLLNEKRYPLAFRTRFPMPEKIDESKVNSILRPTLPSGKWWIPRRPF